MQHVETIIQPKWLITVDSRNRVLENHSLVVDRGKILDIVPNLQLKTRYTAIKTHYLDNHAILPGFINAHTHAAMSLMRGFADDLPLMTWLTKFIWPGERLYVSPEFVCDGMRLALAEMIKGGTTCINDMYFYSSEAAEVMHKSGIRGRIADSILNIEMPWAPTVQSSFDKTLALIQQVKAYPLIEAAIGPHAPYTTDDDIMREVVRLSKQHAAPIQMHIHETQYEVDKYLNDHQTWPLARLHELGVCSPKLQAVHMTQVSQTDIEILAKTGTHVIHCPESNMKLGSGICPVQTLLEAGVNVALGTDGAASNNDLDMIGEMRTAALLGKIRDHNPESLSAQTVLRMATINGAKALGFDYFTGSLEVGKAADVIAIDLNAPATMPVYNPVSQIVYSSSRDQVTDVWVAGKQLLKSRSLTTLNEAEILNQATQWGEKLRKVVSR
ncbi:MAG: mtaD [Gammaproteobacteria bacterium]|jgi:5-methylthioadenosine/S-adenosylhomocysteine deaminase|nr:mtaD [Gammaproteobacteria bacterium]